MTKQFDHRRGWTLGALTTITLVAALALGLLIVGSPGGANDSDPVVQVAGTTITAAVEAEVQQAGMRLPSILFETPSDAVDLPLPAREFFNQVMIPDRAGDQVPGLFYGLHQVAGPHDSVAVVGIDSTGRFICQTIQVTPNSAMVGGCTHLASFAAFGGLTLMGVDGPDGKVVSGFVSDETTEIWIDGKGAQLTDSIFFASAADLDLSPVGYELIRMQLANGSTIQGGKLPGGVRVIGIHNGRRLSDPFAAGCVTFEGGFGARALVLGDDGLFLATISESSIIISDTVAHAQANLTVSADDVVITATISRTGPVVDASWTSDESTGNIHIQCGRNHVDSRLLTP